MIRNNKKNKKQSKNPLLKKSAKVAANVSALAIVFMLQSSDISHYYEDPERYQDFSSWAERIDTIKTTDILINKISGSAYAALPLGDIRTQFVKLLSETVARTSGNDFQTKDYTVNSTHSFSYALNDILKYQTPDQYKNVTFDALNALLKTLDPHSAFLSPEESLQRKNSLSGYQQKIEFEVVDDNSIFPWDEEHIELQADDIITEIDGQPTDIEGDKIDLFLRGPVNVGVNINIIRDNQQITVTTKQSHVIKSPVKTSVLSGNIGYVLLESFTEQSDEFLRQAIADMESSPTPPTSYILDLRNNRGGYMQQAINIVDYFVDEGTIVSSANHNGTERIYEATHGDIIKGKALAVLVNGMSASSSEIVAGALQQLGRASIVGTVSYGKGSFQSTFDYAHTGSLVLTTGMYYLGGTTSIQGVGITPNIQVTFGRAVRPSAWSEASYSNSLENPAPPKLTNSAMQCFRPESHSFFLPRNLQQDDGEIDSTLACAMKYLNNELPYATLRTASINISSKELRPALK